MAPGVCLSLWLINFFLSDFLQSGGRWRSKVGEKKVDLVFWWRACSVVCVLDEWLWHDPLWGRQNGECVCVCVCVRCVRGSPHSFLHLKVSFVRQFRFTLSWLCWLTPPSRCCLCADPFTVLCLFSLSLANFQNVSWNNYTSNFTMCWFYLIPGQHSGCV